MIKIETEQCSPNSVVENKGKENGKGLNRWKVNIQEFPWRGDLNRVNSEAESHYRVSPAASVRPRAFAGSFVPCERGWSPFYPMPRVSGARLWSEGNYRSETWMWFEAGRGRDRTRCRECLASDTTGQVPGDSHRLKRDYPTALIVVNYGVLLILLLLHFP